MQHVFDTFTIEMQEPVDRVFHLDFPNQYKITSTFLRFQEHFESPKFRGKIFSLEDYMDWYAKENDNFTYYQDWRGFNIPSHILTPFSEGKFDPLSRKENALLGLFHDKPHPFYVIATFQSDKASTINHEIAHGLFYTNDAYRSEVLPVLKTVDACAIENYLKETGGYHPSVWVDETHAHLLDLDHLVKKKVSIKGLRKPSERLQKIFDKYAVPKQDI